MKRPALLLTALLACAVPPVATAATTEHDLGQGLHYLRVTDLVADFPTLEKTLAARPAAVLDLRQTTATPDAAIALRTSLARPLSTAHTARLLLLSEATPREVINALPAALPSTLTLAAATSSLTPDIAITTPPDEDRRAYDALTTGTSIDKLLSGSIPQKKARYDEASLVRDHANGTTRASSSFGPDEDDDPEPPEPAPTAAPTTPPVDRVLLRAVHLHRALLALKKL